VSAPGNNVPIKYSTGKIEDQTAGAGK